MKKTLFFIAAAIALVACTTKENPDPQVIDNPSNTGKVTLTATMPQFASTKAAVSSAGVFSWAENDVIDVVYSNGTFQFSCTDATNGTFTLVSGEPSGDPTAAYYPTGYTGTASNQSFDSIEDAAKGFQMTASYDNDSGKLNFVHDNAMMVVTVKNVPSIATKLTVGGATVTLDNQSGNITAYVPLAPAAAAKLAISVSYGENTLISKTSANEVAIAEKNLYNLKDLEIVPTVYLVRDLDGDNWSDGESTILSSPTGTTYTANIRSFGGTRYFRYDVKYPSGVTVQYGNSEANVDGSTGGTFVGNSDKSASLSCYGLNSYTIGFNYLNGVFTVSAANPINLYLIGINGYWTFDSETNPLTRVIGDYYCWTGRITNNKAKMYESSITAWGTGTYPSSDMEFTTNADSDQSVFINTNDNFSYFAQSAFNKTSVSLRGSFDVSNGEWGDGRSFTETSYLGLWLIDSITFNEEVQAKIVVGSSWTGISSETTVISGNRIYDLSTVGSGNDFKIAAGTYKIGYNDNTNTLYFEVL